MRGVEHSVQERSEAIDVGSAETRSDHDADGKAGVRDFAVMKGATDASVSARSGASRGHGEEQRRARRGRGEWFSLMTAALVVGVVGAAVAIGFRWLIEGAFWFIGKLSDGTGTAGALALVGLAVVGTVVMVVVRHRVAQPSDLAGMQGVLMTTATEFRVRPAILASLGCAIGTSAGASAGCEGPAARVVGSVGSWLTYRLKLDASARPILVASGVAATLAGLFHTPIAAVVFAFEVILGAWQSTRAIAPMLVASMVAALGSRFIGGLQDPLQIDGFVLQGPLDLVAHLVVGLATGLLAAGLLHLVDIVQAGFNKWWYVTEPIAEGAGVVQRQRWIAILGVAVLAGLIVGGVLVLCPQVAGVGYPVMQRLFDGHFALGVVAILLVGKLVASVVTLGAGGIGGLLAPSMVIGAAGGWLLGSAMISVFPGELATPESFGATAMMAMFAGVAHAPFAAAIMLVECTGTYQAVLPAVIAVMIASWVSSNLHSDSAYSTSFPSTETDASVAQTIVLHDTDICHLVDNDVDTIPSSHSVENLLERFHPSLHDSVHESQDQPLGESRASLPRRAVVVVEEGKPIGIITSAAFNEWAADECADSHVRDCMEKVEPLDARVTLTDGCARFLKNGVDALPVVDADGAVLGAVWRTDLMQRCADGVLQQCMQFEVPIGLQVHDSSAPQLQVNPAPYDPSIDPLRFEVAAVVLDERFTGVSLRELELGKQFGVVVIGIRRPTPAGEFAAQPLQPSLVLRKSDVLMFAGVREDLYNIFDKRQ